MLTEEEREGGEALIGAVENERGMLLVSVSIFS